MELSTVDCQGMLQGTLGFRGPSGDGTEHRREEKLSGI